MSGPNSAGALLLGVAAGRRGCGRRVGGDTKPCQSRGPRGRWQWGGRGVRQGASDAAELAAAVGRGRARSHLARGGGGADRAAWGRARTVREVGIRVLYGCFIGRSGRTGEGVTAVPHWAERWVATVRRPTNGESPVHGWRTSRRKPGMRGTRDWGGSRLTYRRSTMELACARPLPSRCRAGFSETDTGTPALHTQQGPAMGDDPPRALSVQDEKRASAGGRKAEGVFKSGCQWPDWRPQDPTLREHYKQV